MQNQWYIARDGKQYGPVSDGDLAQLVRNRELLDGDYLWRQGFESWLPAAQVPEVRHFASNPMAEIPPAGTPGFGGQGDPRGGNPQAEAAYQAARSQQDAAREAAQDAGREAGNPAAGRWADAAQQAAAFRNGNAAQAQADMQRADTQRADWRNGDWRNGQVAGGQGGFGPQQDEYGPTSADQPGHDAEAGYFGAGRYGAAAGEQADESAGQHEHALPAARSLDDDPKNYYGEDIQDLVEDHDASLMDPYNDARENGARGADAGVNGEMNDAGYAGDGAYGPLGGAAKDDAPVGGGFLSARQGGGFNGFSGGETITGEDDDVRASRFPWPFAVGLGVAALFILIVGATFALPFIVPPETVKRQISAAIKEQTGRDITFKGKIAYRFFPSFGLDLNNIVVHNPPNIKGPDFVSIGRLQADLSLLPLLSKKVDVKRIALHRPEITLIDDGRGNTNYSIKSAAFQRLVPLLSSFKVAQGGTIDTSDIIARTLEKLEREEAAKKAAEQAGDNGTPASSAEEADAALKPEGSDTEADPRGPEVASDATKTLTKAPPADIQVGEVEIVNGALKLIDQKNNSETDINAINVTLTAPAADQDVTANGTVRFREDRINLNANLSTLGPLLKGEAVDSTLKMNSDRFEGKFTGKMKFVDGFQYSGDADIQTFSLQNLLNWFGVDVAKQGYGGAYIRGKMAGNKDTVVLKNATIKLDQTTLLGNLRVRQTAARPRLEAALSTDFLNLEPYLSKPNEIKRGSLEGGRQTAVAAWNSSRIDLSFLNSFDGDVTLEAGRLVALGHPIEKSRIAVKVDGGRMNASIPSFQLYGGTGSLNVDVNGADPRAGLKGRVNLNKVNVKPLLTNAAGLDWISGDADVSFDVTSTGSSELELISGLNGTGKFIVLNGALEGINIPGMVRNLQRGNLLTPAGDPSEKTDFSELSATFNIERGVVQNKDLMMKGPLLRMAGEGNINLPSEQIDYGLTPKIVGSLDGQGGDANLTGINIPLRLTGPLSNPKIKPDAAGLLNNKEAINNTVDNVKKLAKDLKKKKISSDEMKGLLNGMINGDENSGKALENMFQ